MDIVYLVIYHGIPAQHFDGCSDQVMFIAAACASEEAANKYVEAHKTAFDFEHLVYDPEWYEILEMFVHK